MVIQTLSTALDKNALETINDDTFKKIESLIEVGDHFKRPCLNVMAKLISVNDSRVVKSIRKQLIKALDAAPEAFDVAENIVEGFIEGSKNGVKLKEDVLQAGKLLSKSISPKFAMKIIKLLELSGYDLDDDTQKLIKKWSKSAKGKTKGKEQEEADNEPKVAADKGDGVSLEKLKESIEKYSDDTKKLVKYLQKGCQKYCSKDQECDKELLKKLSELGKSDDVSTAEAAIEMLCWIADNLEDEGLSKKATEYFLTRFAKDQANAVSGLISYESQRTEKSSILTEILNKLKEIVSENVLAVVKVLVSALRKELFTQDPTEEQIKGIRDFLKKKDPELTE